MKVRKVFVSLEWGENEVDVEYLDFDSVDDLWNHIDQEYDEEDVNDETIRDQYGDDDIIINGDVWFVRFQIVEE